MFRVTTFTIVCTDVTNVELDNLRHFEFSMDKFTSTSPKFLNSEYIVYYLCTSTFLHGIENILGDFMASS